MADQNRRYLVGSYPPVFKTGRLPDGTQCLFGVQGTDFVIVYFTADGAFRNLERKPELINGVTDEGDIDELVQQWESKVGIAEGRITVQPFFIEEQWIGIRDIPEHYQDVVESPDTFLEDDRQRLLKDVNEWLERGDFVFYWDEDYYLNADGEVEST